LINSISSNITYKTIFLFWLPLAGTWLMMSVEGPFLASLIARMGEPKFNLAAYGVAFSIALIAEAPIIMMLSAATALVKDKLSFLKLRNFTFLLNLIITLIFCLVLIDPIYKWWAIDLINLPEEVASITHISLWCLIPWPAAIGYRRFYQGVLIKYGFTKRVAYGTVVRLFAMSTTAFLLFIQNELDGAVVGGIALSAGVLAESLASKLMTIDVVKQIRSENPDNEKLKGLTYLEISKFYYPLALTSLISLGVHPIITFFVGHSRMSLESLAVLPVINSLVFIFRSFGLSFQEVGIALMGEKYKNYSVLKNFAVASGVCSALLLIIIAFTPLADFWFNDISGLSVELTHFSLLPLQLFAIMPALTFFISFQRSLLVYSRSTNPITWATFIEVFTIILILLLSISFFDLVGAVAATLSLVIGRLAANFYLHFPYRNLLKHGL
jgi:hypothetical protein